MSGYRAVLSIAGLPRALVSCVVGRLPLGIYSLAVLLLVEDRTGSIGVAGVTVGAFAVTGAIAAPVQGALVDRLGQPRVLLVSAVTQAALLVALVVVASSGASDAAIVAVAAAAGALMPPLAACARALWSEVPPDPLTREATFALDAITQELIFVGGPLIVAVLVAVASPAAAVLLCAALTLVGTGVFATSPLSRRWRAEVYDGARRRALSSPELRVVVASVALMGFGMGALQVAIPTLALESGSTRDAGILLALWGLGSAAGGVVYGARSWRGPIRPRYRVLLFALAVCDLPLMASHSFALSMVLCALAGLPMAPVFSCQYGLVAELAPPGTRTEAFTWQTAALFTGAALGSAMAGVLTGASGVASVFALGGLTAAMSAVTMLGPAVSARRR
jgi:MFS family permease